MRRLRYEELHTYMLEVFEFDGFAGKRVLDAGCGGGIDAVEFAKNGADVYAVDLTEESARRTRELAESLSLDVEVSEANLCGMPYSDEFFDHVHCFGVLHHIHDVDAAVKEVHRALRKGGTAYVMLYNRDSILYYYSLLFQRGIEQGCFIYMSIDEVVSMFSEAEVGCPYTRVYTKNEAEKLFSRFDEVTVEAHYNVYDTSEQRKVNFDGPQELGWHLVVKAVK